MSQSIILKDVNFFKAAKKLHTQLGTITKTIKLSHTQEILAKSLGYRNLNHILTLNRDSENSSKTLTRNPLQQKTLWEKVTAEEATQVVKNILEEGNSDMWQMRAINLIQVLLDTLYYLADNKENAISTNRIQYYLNLSNLLALYKTKEKVLPEPIKERLYGYFQSLPGFQKDANIQSNIVHEQHGYLSMQLTFAMQNLQKIEQNDFIIADKSWFIPRTDEKLLNPNPLNSKETKTPYIIIPSILELENIEDSWLADEFYSDWITELLKRGQLKTIYISDLVIHLTTIFNPAKKIEIKSILHNLLQNYSLASKISQRICQAAEEGK